MSEIRLPTKETPLPAGGLRALLKTFGGDTFGNPGPSYTGQLTIRNEDGEVGSLFFKSGRIYSARLSEFTPPVAARMLSAGYITTETFTYLNTLQPEHVTAEAVNNQYCTTDEAENLHRQTLLSTLTHLTAWKKATWKWAPNKTTETYTIPGLEPRLLVAAGDERQGQWDALTRNFPTVTKGNAIPQPGPEWQTLEGRTTTPEIAAILSQINGKTNVAQIAGVCGLTRFEIGARLAKAIADGILIVPNPDIPLPATSDSH